MAAETLRYDGYEVLEARGWQTDLNGPRPSPDLVLSDIMMNELDGFGVLQRLRSLPVTSAIPIILMTGVRDDQSMRCSMEQGAEIFVQAVYRQHPLRSGAGAPGTAIYCSGTAKENEVLLLEILAASPDLVAIVADAETRRRSYLNQAGRRMLGIGDAEAVSGLCLDDFEIAPAGGTGHEPVPKPGAQTQSVWTEKAHFSAVMAGAPPWRNGFKRIIHPIGRQSILPSWPATLPGASSTDRSP